MWLIIKKVITEQLIDELENFLIASAGKMEVLTGKNWWNLIQGINNEFI